MKYNNLPRITQWSDVQKLIDEDALTPAEQKVIATARNGGMALIGDAVPKTKTDEVLLRAPLLRYLILGGGAGYRTETSGVSVQGAWIAGKLNLHFALASGPIIFSNCFIAENLRMSQLQVPLLIFKGSTLADGLMAAGADIGNHLILSETLIKGEVNLAGAVIKGQLSCKGATLRNPDGKALNGQRMLVEQAFIWHSMNEVVGHVDLALAHFAALVDDAASWEKCESLSLVGLTYFVVHGSTDMATRFAWLKKGAQLHGNFHPQPYEELAKALRGIGYRTEAVKVMVLKEREQRDAKIRRDYVQECSEERKLGTGKLRRGLRLMGHRLLDNMGYYLTGYGYSPMNSVMMLLALILLTSTLAFATWQSGDFVPNSDVILISADWQVYAASADSPARAWSENALAGRDYETFNALAYGADIVIPLIDFGQEAAWAPSTSRSSMGWYMFRLEWLLTGLGWFFSGILASALTHVFRKD